MAQVILKNAFVKLNTVDLSSKVVQVELDEGVELQDDTAMSKNTKSNAAGLKDWSAKITFIQDYAAGSVDATVDPLVGAAAFAVEFRPDAGAVATANPKWTGNAVVESYTPIAGKVGDLALAQVSLKPASDLTRATA